MEEIRLAEVRIAEVRPAEVHPVEVRPDEVCPDEVRPVEARPDEVCPDEVSPVEDRSSEDRLAEDRPVEAGLPKVRPGLGMIFTPSIPRLDALIQDGEMFRVGHDSSMPAPGQPIGTLFRRFCGE